MTQTSHSEPEASDPYVEIMGETGARMYHRMEALAEKANLEVGRLRSELAHARRDAITEAIDYFQHPRRSSRPYSGQAVARLLESWLDDEDKAEAARPMMPYYEGGPR